MIRLSRYGVRAPVNWRAVVDRALPDFAEYRRLAIQFETLPINSNQRRAGFSTFAAHVLRRRQNRPSFPCCWSSAKEALAAMSRQKCSYCEGEINSLRAGQVEHFKPKSLFPSLAYVWGNYFLACGGCNGAKSDRWPSAGGYLRPDQGDPTTELAFDLDGTVRARRGTAKAQRTIEDMELNRTWLVRRRKTHIKQMLSRLKMAEEVVLVNRGVGCRLAKHELKMVNDPAVAYSAALTECFSLVWKTACPRVRLASTQRRSRQ